jgi:exopolyphosphatase/guanosine-5'-triphosphate,3'-diphosphate pyrophosphatase
MVRDTEGDEELHNSKIAVKLGDGGIQKRVITEASFRRGVEAMKSHRKTIDQLGVDQIYAFATSAIRDSSNGVEFAAEVKEATGITIKIIDGNEEARLIRSGVIRAMDLPLSPVLIMDIGGGSTEFIITQKKELLWMKSYPLGVSRLLEEMRPSDPITEEEINRVNTHIEQSLKDLQEQIQLHQPTLLIGASGSFDTLADICRRRIDQKGSAEGDQPNYLFDLATYRQVEKLILKSTFEERLEIPGMLMMRADMIVLSCLLIRFVLNVSPVRSLWLSRYSLKEGVYFELKEQNYG